LQQILVALIGLFRRGEAGKLTHGEKLATIARGMNSARVRRLAWIVQVLFVRPVFRQVGLRVQSPDRVIGDRRKSRMAVLVTINSRRRADRLLRLLLQRGSQRLLRPLLLGLGRMAVLEDV